MEVAHKNTFGTKPGASLDLNGLLRKLEARIPPAIPKHWVNIADAIRNLGNVPGAHPKPIPGYRFSKRDAVLAYENTVAFVETYFEKMLQMVKWDRFQHGCGAIDKLAVMETPRLLLRQWSAGDLNDLARLLGDPLVVQYITHEYGPLSRDEAIQAHMRILRLWRDLGFGPWAAIEKASGRWVGKIGLNLLEEWPGPHKIEVEWQLAPSFWGRGLATEGGRAGVQYGFETLNLDRIISVTVPANVASWRVMEKCGLTYQGTVQMTGRLTKQTRDVVWYAIDRATWQLQTGSR